nr:response regulator [Lachnospiraceae bacterium]
MSTKDKRKVRALLIVLAVAIVIVGLFHAISLHIFNSEVHTVVGHEPTDDVSMDIHFRGDATSRWEKIDMGIYGNIWDATFRNDSRNIINGWTLTVNIHGDCYLNQYWNGDVEIHQRGVDGQMHVQRLNLATYDVDSLEIDYLYDGSDLMIPLQEGDSFVYYPTEKFKETTVHPEGEIVTGFIIYYADDMDLSDYHVDFTFHRSFRAGLAYGILFLLIIAFILVAGMGIFWRVIYRKAQKEMDLRLSGLSCMSDMYVTIYIIDLIEQTITAVGMTDEEDRYRPKDKSVNEQMMYFAEFDADEDYQGLMKEFVNLETLAQRMENRNTLAFEYHGKYFGWCCIRFMAMDREEGMPLQKVLFTVQDINEEKKELDDIYEQVEEAKSESSAKSAFLANMSHEIRTPINTVIGLDTMILRESKNEVVRGYAKQIKTASSMLLSLINSILDFSKLEAGKMELMPGEYSLTSLVRDLQIIIKARAQEKNLDLKIDVTESIPDKLYGDDVRLKQVILNLLTNAVKYTEQGSVRLGIYGKQVEDDQVHLLISVKDTGSGIKEENKEALFQRFARIEEDKNRKIEGTGIGMSLVNGLLELMNSELKVATIYGRGSDFYFEIDQKVMGEKPVGKVDWSTITLDDEDEEGYAASFTAPQAHVLVVDDHDMNLMVFKNLVKETQIQVDTATSGKKALEMTKEKTYHLIFMDHMMPQMSGIEAMQLIKEQQDGQNQKTPIIILTANALQGAKDEYEKMGFADFMAKPIKPEILEEKILAHLPKKLTKAAPS